MVGFHGRGGRRHRGLHEAGRVGGGCHPQARLSVAGHQERRGLVVVIRSGARVTALRAMRLCASLGWWRASAFFSRWYVRLQPPREGRYS